MQRQIIQTENAPAAIGPYSQAVRVGQTVYLSGQIGLDPQTQALAGDSLESQARQVFSNLAAVAVAAGGDLGNVAKVNLYLTDIAAFAQVNEVMKFSFDEPFPARAAVGVAALPKGALVEAEAIMVLDQAS